MNKYIVNSINPLVVVLSVLFLGLEAKAQEIQVPENEFSVYLKGPFSRISFDMGSAGEGNDRFGVGLGFQYARYFDFNWSVSGALEYQFYRSEALLSAFSDSYSTTDMEGEDFEFRYSLSSYQEWINLGMLNIPLRVQYEKEISETLKFFGASGFSVGIPIRGTYQSRAFGLKTEAYYEQWDALLTSPKFVGFGTWGNPQPGKKDFSPKTSFSFLLEAGLKHKLAEGRNLYAGLFVDVPLSQVAKSGSEDKPLIEYNTDNPTQMIYNSVIDSAPGAQGKHFADKPKAFAFGFKLRYAFDF